MSVSKVKNYMIIEKNYQKVFLKHSFFKSIKIIKVYTCQNMMFVSTETFKLKTLSGVFLCLLFWTRESLVATGSTLTFSWPFGSTLRRKPCGREG